MRKLKALLVVVITLLVLVPPAISQRTSVSRNFPVYDNGGKPDLVVDPQRFVSQMEIVDRFFTEKARTVTQTLSKLLFTFLIRVRR